MQTPSPPPLKRLCVFLGAKPGHNPRYRAAAHALGQQLARSGIELVYGGGNTGLMGVLANGCLEAGGHVIGVIPKALVGLEIEGVPVEHTGVSRLEVVASMHARKARMAELADGFIALPGGYGTLEELFEVVTWAQLGFHQKPIGLLNTDAFYSPLLAYLDRLLEEGFIKPHQRDLLKVADTPAHLLEKLAQMPHEPPTEAAWLKQPGDL